MAAGGLAAGAAALALKRLARGEAPDFRGALLSDPNAKRLTERLGRLRGAAMKIGQMVSMQGEDLLPTEFAQALSALRSQAAPMPPQPLHRVLGRECGAGWQRRFTSFDREPIAAASIGQVHRATAADGRDLALKIQYPEVARSTAGETQCRRCVDRAAAVSRTVRVSGNEPASRLVGWRILVRGIPATRPRDAHVPHRLSPTHIMARAGSLHVRGEPPA